MGGCRNACPIHSPWEGLDGEAGDLPLRESGGGASVCVREGGQGTVADLHADVGDGGWSMVDGRLKIADEFALARS